MALARQFAPVLTFLIPGAAVLGVVYGPFPDWSIAAASVAWFIVVGPAAVYATITRPLESPPYVVLPDGSETTTGSDEWGRWVADQLAAHGFVPRARYFLPGPNALDFGRRLDNPSTGEVAVIMAGWRRLFGDRDTPLRVVVFYTAFRDGGELLTTNSPLSKMTPDLPGQVSYRLPEVTDPTALYSVHKRLARSDARKPKPIVLSDDPLAWEREQNRREIATEVALGLGVRDERAGVMRPTLKGAFRSTWLLHPWLAPLQNWRATHAGAAALRAIPG